jgi:DNA-directed RNA polymerase specialized sigma24 family protein
LAYRHLIGLSESETATMLSISPGSVKTHGSRARQRMRTLLAD